MCLCVRACVLVWCVCASAWTTHTRTRGIELHKNVLSRVQDNVVKVRGIQIHHIASGLTHTHTCPCIMRGRGEGRGQKVAREGTTKQARYHDYLVCTTPGIFTIIQTLRWLHSHLHQRMRQCSSPIIWQLPWHYSLHCCNTD